MHAAIDDILVKSRSKMKYRFGMRLRDVSLHVMIILARVFLIRGENTERRSNTNLGSDPADRRQLNHSQAHVRRPVSESLRRWWPRYRPSPSRDGYRYE